MATTAQTSKDKFTPSGILWPIGYQLTLLMVLGVNHIFLYIYISVSV